MLRFKQYLGEKVDLPAKSKIGKIDRKDMPQIDNKNLDDFTDYLKEKGVNSSEVKIDPNKLKASQSQFHKAKIEKMMDSIGNGKKMKSIIVSSDDYVIDGHHNWIAHMNLGKEVSALKIDVKREKLLDYMMDFPKSYTNKLYEEKRNK
jgi:hypothetical protein